MNLVPSKDLPIFSFLPKNPAILYPKYVLELILWAKLNANSLSPIMSICFRLRLFVLIILKTSTTSARSNMAKIMPKRLKSKSIILEKLGWFMIKRIATSKMNAIMSAFTISSAPEKMED